MFNNFLIPINLLSSFTPLGCAHCKLSYSVLPYDAPYTAILEYGLHINWITSFSQATLLRNSSAIKEIISN